MKSENEAWEGRLRPSLLRIVAPVFSMAILIALTAQASDCTPRRDVRSRPARPDIMKSTKSYGIDARIPHELNTFNSLGGSKSGLGGLGLFGMQPAQSSDPAPPRKRVHKKK